MFGYRNFRVPQYLEENKSLQNTDFVVWIIIMCIVGFIGTISLYWQILSVTALISFFLLGIDQGQTSASLIDFAELKQIQECIKSTNEKLEESNKKLETIAALVGNLAQCNGMDPAFLKAS